MRLFHLAGCLVRAVKVVPVAAITAVIIPFALTQSGGQFAMLLESTTGRLFVYGFAGIFLLSIVGGLGKRRRELGCLVMLIAIVPFLLLGALTAYLASSLTVAALGAGPAAESSSLLTRFWAVLNSFPGTVQIATVAGAVLGLVGLSGDIKYGGSDN